jgi:hydrogenase-4 component D
VGAIAYATGTKSISALGGLGRRMPLVATAFFVGLFAVTGIPPFACFWSKFLILIGALELGGALGPLLAALIVAESMIAFGWFLYVGQRVFLGQPGNPTTSEAKDPGWAMSLPLVVLILLTVVVPMVGLRVIQRITLPG